MVDTAEGVDSAAGSVAEAVVVSFRFFSFLLSVRSLLFSFSFYLAVCVLYNEAKNSGHMHSRYTDGEVRAKRTKS